MIRIFNPKLNTQIIIEKSDWVNFMPRDYEDIPNVIIEFKNGFNFLKHAKTCKGCKRFVQDFGKSTIEWYIQFNEKTLRLDLSNFKEGSYYSNKASFTSSSYMYGSTLKLIVHKLSTDKEEIQAYLNELVKNERFEEACMVRDLTHL